MVADEANAEDSIRAWPQIGDILRNHGGGRPDPTGDLRGQAILVDLEDGSALSLTFESGTTLCWSIDGQVRAKQPYEAFHVRAEGYYVDFVDADNDLRSIGIWIDLARRRAVLIEISLEDRRLEKCDLLSRLADGGSQSMAALTIRSGRWGVDNASEPYRAGDEILGRFVRFTYSDTHVYDHYYVSREYYHWYCWQGPDAGLGELDEVRHRQLDDELFLVCWAEKLLPCAAITIEDYRSMRSIGKVFGVDTRTWQSGNATVGADMTMIARIPNGA